MSDTPVSGFEAVAAKANRLRQLTSSLERFAAIADQLRANASDLSSSLQFLMTTCSDVEGVVAMLAEDEESVENGGTPENLLREVETLKAKLLELTEESRLNRTTADTFKRLAEEERGKRLALESDLALAIRYGMTVNWLGYTVEGRDACRANATVRGCKQVVTDWCFSIEEAFQNGVLALREIHNAIEAEEEAAKK